MSGGIVSFLICFVVIFVIIVFYAISRYKKCPHGKILVVYTQTGEGKTFKPITKGGVIVLPIIQDYQYLDLTPIAFDINLKNILSLDNTRLNISLMTTVGISTEPSVMENAVEMLLGKNQESIQDMAKDIITGQIRLVTAQTNITNLKKNIDKFISLIFTNTECELKKIGLKLINIDINNIIDENGKRLIYKQI